MYPYKIVSYLWPQQSLKDSQGAKRQIFSDCYREFMIITDHKPLLQILGPTNLVPVHTAARLQRWALILASFKYKLEYRSTHLHGNADFVSSLPLPGAFCAHESTNVDCHFFEGKVVSNITAELIAKCTVKDPVLSKAVRFIMHGWPSAIEDPLLVPFSSSKLELTVEQGCILWGNRVIIPKELREAVMQELHDTHPGMTCMKRLARYMCGGQILMSSWKESLISVTYARL